MHLFYGVLYLFNVLNTHTHTASLVFYFLHSHFILTDWLLLCLQLCFLHFSSVCKECKRGCDDKSTPNVSELMAAAQTGVFPLHTYLFITATAPLLTLSPRQKDFCLQIEIRC